MDNKGESESCCQLPEGCIAEVLALTTPHDTCRLSVVSKLFQSAADSDGVWKKLLPSDYPDIIARSINLSLFPRFSSTKDLYLHLSDHPLIIDYGDKSFSLEKWSGKKCYMLAARSLKIVWSCTPRYWTWTSLPYARFEEVAELHGVGWLEISGNINTCLLSPDTNYAAYLVYKLTRHAFGFDLIAGQYGPPPLPAEVSAGLFGEKKIHYAILKPDRRAASSKRRYKTKKKNEANMKKNEANIRYPSKRKDGWFEVEMGEFFNKRGANEDVEMCLEEIKAGTWKGGLIVLGIEIRPKEGN